MNISEETKKNLLANLLREIWHVSDKEYQKRIWIEGKGPQCDDYDETSIGILDDGEVIIKNHSHFKMTEDQYKILSKFWHEYESFSNGSGFDRYLPEFFIDTPEWTRITELAQEVIKAFDYHYKFPSC